MTITVGGTSITFNDGTTQTTAASANVVVRAVKSATQSIAASTWTKIQFDSATIGVNGTWNTSSYRFTAGSSGYYQVNSSIAELPNNAQPLYLAIYKNGTFYSYTSQYNGYGLCLGDVVYLNGSTDYIEMYVGSFGTGNTIYGSGAVGQFVSLFRI